MPRSPVQPEERAQNDFLRALSAGVLGLGAGALRFEPVAALYLARPLAVSPAPLETGSFSPRPTERFGDFLGMFLCELGPILASLDGNEALDKLGVSVWVAVLNRFCVGLCFFALFVFHGLCWVV